MQLLLPIGSTLAFFTTATAQTNSPYSRYGIGTLMQQESIPALGSGGASIAAGVFGQINALNPATYSQIGITSIQLAALAERNRVSTKDSLGSTGSVNLSHFMLGMPIGKKGGFALGLMPESRVGYKALRSTNPFDSTVVQSAFSGSGGIEKIFLGYGHQIGGFSIGANVQFLYGNIAYDAANFFYDTADAYSAEYSENFLAKGIQYNVGAMYQHTFNKGKLNGKTISIGSHFTPATKLNTSGEYFYRAVLGSSIIDTLIANRGSKGTLQLPASFGLGLMLKQQDRWRITADYQMAQWKNFRRNGDTDSTNNIAMLKVGAAYRKALTENENYLSRIEYRGGFFAGTDYVRLNNTNIAQWGVTAGLGAPLKMRRNAFGTLNTSLQIGRRGTTSNGLMQEGFTRFHIGLTLHEKWFIKRKYD